MFLTPCSGSTTISTNAEKAAKYMSDNSDKNTSKDNSGKDSGGVSSGRNEDDSEWNNDSSVYFQFCCNSEVIDIVMQLLTELLPQSLLSHLCHHLCCHMGAFLSFLPFCWQLAVPHMGIWLSWLQLALQQFLPIPKQMTKLPAALQ
jgi:hypothetical protein